MILNILLKRVSQTNAIRMEWLNQMSHEDFESSNSLLMDNNSFVAHLFNVKNMFTSNHPQNKR